MRGTDADALSASYAEGVRDGRKEVEAREAALREALRRYGTHERWCGYTLDHATLTGELISDCTCGLDALLVKLGGKP